jgi:hypothetical protein
MPLAASVFDRVDPAGTAGGDRRFRVILQSRARALKVIRPLPSILPRGAILPVCPGTVSGQISPPDEKRVRSRPFAYCHSAVFRTSAMILGESHFVW